MRVAIVHFPSRGPEALAAVAKAMAGALEAAGHRVELFDPKNGGATRLAGFDYVIVGTESASLGGKIQAHVADYLAQSQGLSGRRSMAFVRSSGPGSSRALRRLMSVMEAEGMFVNCGEIVSGASGAAEAARAAPIERA